MAAWRRCVAGLMSCVLSSLITGSEGQCKGNTSRLRASVYHPKTIFSPGYPRNYPDDANCRWKLYTTEPGYVIHVHVVWLDLEDYTDCSYDALVFYDGQTTFHEKLATLCTERVKDVYSTSNFITVQFVSDFSVTDRGFQLEYSAISRSHVPSTVTPRYPWPDRGDSSTRASSSTTDPGSTYSWPSYNMAVLIGGVTGGLVLLFTLCAFTRYYFNRYYHGRRETARPYRPTAPPPPPSTIYHNNNAVFMVSSSAPSAGHPFQSHPPAYGGINNLGFSPHGEAPPAYVSVQQSTTLVQPGANAAMMDAMFCSPPPTYTEAMKLSHPPAPPDPPTTHVHAPTRPPHPAPSQAPGPAPNLAQGVSNSAPPAALTGPVVPTSSVPASDLPPYTPFPGGTVSSSVEP